MTIEFKGQILEVEADITKDSGDIYSAPYTSIEITKLTWNGFDVTDLILDIIDNKDFDKLEEKILEEYETDL